MLNQMLSQKDLMLISLLYQTVKLIKQYVEEEEHSEHMVELMLINLVTVM